MARLGRTKRVFASCHAVPALSAELADAIRTLKDLFNPYRPERHYMRGPGPKWHAKHRRATGSELPASGLAQAKI